MKSKNLLRQGFFFVIVFVIIFLVSSPMTSVFGYYIREDFTLTNETREFLNIETEDANYTGSIIVTLTSGANLTATFNGDIKNIMEGQAKTFIIYNVSNLKFEITTEGVSIGYFELDLNVAINTGNDNPIITILVILGSVLFAISVIAYYLRLRSFKRDPDEEDEEYIDPEVAKRRKESAGAEKQFWSLDKED